MLADDRAEKVEKIEEQRKRITKLLDKLRVAENAQGPNAQVTSQSLQDSLRRSREHLEWLKVQADINDPLVKRRFEDGFGMSFSPQRTALQLELIYFV